LRHWPRRSSAACIEAFAALVRGNGAPLREASDS